MPKILIVEDDQFVAEGLIDILRGAGYEAVATDCGKQACELVQNGNIAMVLLDINLGKENGYDICRNIRIHSDLPILFLTAYTGEVELVRAFQAGGDDYLTKPFRMQELLVRIQALLRRSQSGSSARVVTGDLVWEKKKQELKRMESGEWLELTPIEYRLAEKLLDNYPNTISRLQLLYAVWDKDAAFVDENTLTVNISRLREKLGNYQGMPYIATVRGVGYRWDIPVNAAAIGGSIQSENGNQSDRKS